MGRLSYTRLVWGNPSYRKVWLGEVVSYGGDWFSMVALLTIIQQITDSALAVSGVVVAKMLPAVLVVPIAGPLVDRFDRRAILIATDLGRFVCVLGLLLAYHLDDLALLYVFLVVMVGMSGIFLPARSAAIPEITNDEELPVAMALSGGTWSILLAVGAALGGLATEVVGVTGALVIDAGTFLVSAALLWGLPALPPTPSDEGAGFFEGLKYLARTRHVALLTVGKAVMLTSGGLLAMLPLYGGGVFPQAGPLWIGVLYALRGVGASLGSLGVRAVVGDAPRTLRAALAPAMVVTGLGCAAVAVSPGIWTAGLGILIASLGGACIWVFAGTLLQYAVTPGYRGRVFSVEMGALTLMASVTSLGAGALVDGAGWTPDAVMAGSGVLVAVLGTAWAAAVWATAPSAPISSAVR